MVKLNKIYTRTGDDGTTGLVGGARRSKYDLRVETYGTVDEVNSSIGLCRLHSHPAQEIDKILNRIQHDLFDLGADLSTPYVKDEEDKALRIISTQVMRLEEEIDAANAGLSPLNSFVLPGGSALAAYLHMARTLVRRAERLACRLAAEEEINAEAVKYLNRLSDHLFVMARVANENGASDVLWQPGVNR